MIFPRFRDSEIPIIDRPFFTILRSSLWQTPVDTSAWPEVVDWEPIIAAFEAHALLGVVGHTILSLPKDKGIQSPQLQDRILTYVGQVMKQRHKTRKIICDIFTKFEEAGINPILLKGEGLASLYPKTCHRSVGDIDIYVGEKNYKKAVEVIDEFCGQAAAFGAHKYVQDFHYHIYYGTLAIEVHKRAVEASIEKYDTTFNRWATSWLNADKSDHVIINNSEISIPNSQFNAIFVFDHMCKHLKTEGGALRQMVDLALLLNSIDIDKVQFEEDLKRVGIYRNWLILMGILVCQLGLPKEKAILYDENLSSKYQTKLLYYIFNSGTMGRSIDNSEKQYKQSSNFFTYFIGAAIWHFNLYRIKSILFPKEAKKEMFNYMLSCLSRCS